MAIGSEREMERLGGYNPKPSEEMKASGQMNEMELFMEEAVDEDEAVFAELAPQGPFTKKAVNALVKSTNELLPLFGQEPTYPDFEGDVEGLPTDFVRVLAMFQGAVNAAVDAEMVDEEFDFMLEDLTDDRALLMLAGKLKNLSKQRDFKTFLKNPPMEEMDEEEAMVVDNEMNEPAPQDIDALFAMRV